MSRERYSRSERIERDRFADERDRFEERDRVYSRGPREPVREHSVDDRFERRAGRRAGPPPFDDDLVRDRRFYDEYDKFGRRPGPPPPPIVERELRRQYRSPSPPQRPPVLLRRQSSLDTFDRRPSTRLFDQPRAYRYGPPARRDDYVSRDDDLYDPDPLPLTRSRGQPARRRDYYDEIGIAEPDFYGDDEFRPYPERIREREVVRTRHEHRSTSRDRSTSRGRSSRGRSRRGGSTIRSLSISSSSSSSSSDVTTVRSEYPKKGKTRIPARLVSRKALIDLGYPFVEEGNTIIVQKALGQENIDDLLKLSERYKKTEIEIDRNRNGSTRVVEETRREVQETNPRNSAPVVIPASPPSSLEVVDRTVIRDVSPARSYTTSGHSSHHHHHHHHHRHNDGALYVEIKDRPAREVSEPVPVGPLALAERRRSRSDREIREEIRALEAELARHPGSGTTEIVRAERLPDGHLVVYDEHIERVETPPRGVRIERDRKGRMSISVPRRY